MKKRTKQTLESMDCHSKMQNLYLQIPMLFFARIMQILNIDNQIMGHIGSTLLVLVVYTMRDTEGEEIIRIISARKTTAAERRKYEAGTWF